jgi:DNA-binding NtrC family response regulator
VQLFGSEEHGVIVPGCFEQANGGTLLLDEIGDLDLETQSRLISTLQERLFLRVGGRASITMDVRVIATTRHDLSIAVKEGRFREDLFYRLNVVPIQTPPLRRHAEDIDMLCEHYLRWMVEQERLPGKRLTPEALSVLKHYHWPGNVRELKNVIQRLVILGRSSEISANEVQKALGSEPGDTGTGQSENFDQEMRLARDEFERAYLLYHLERNGGNVTALAETSGMERTHLYRKLKQLGIHPKSMKQK